ncbi:UNVERIFIED_CONTAM: hypothetical protein Sangu_2617600 [Sesamum angustifolium]|uniref:Uncharacterized protein n=1 Tax=Sesamum angustifolium TaxID=2727405 RepID=A0AAW2J4L4_9LAMI
MPQHLLRHLYGGTVPILFGSYSATPSDMDAPEEEAEGDIPVPLPPQDVPPQWLAHFECLQKGLQNVQY